ncbi:MAG: hypothetical protein JWP57_2044 [Spirosoma sp.]|nr:hypothetical protein [Spirosoma sp.]
MPRLIETYGNIRMGKLSIINRDEFTHALHSWPDGEVSLTIKPLGKGRSSAQSRYYFGVVVPIIRDCLNESQGELFDKDEVHEWLKSAFNSREIETENGHSLSIAHSTKRLNTAEFTDYIERCRQFAASFFGVSIPDPVKIATTKTELNV